MGEQAEDKKTQKPAKHICVGLLAHVDAGKTTLAEQILYRSGMIRRLGRVDHRDAFLDTDRQERERGITIFSKQASFTWKDLEVTLLDTPGHVDFAAEMERTLQVLDYAVLIISGADGVQGHTLTLWRLLERYQVPVFLFINKMDQPGTEADALLAELRKSLDERCVSFMRQNGDEAAFYENIAVCDEELLERYLYLEEVQDHPGGRKNQPPISAEEIGKLTAGRKLFPCFFGSALRGDGVEALLDGLYDYARRPSYGEDFGARVFKITRDSQGVRLTHVKVTGGSLKVKQMIHVTDRSAGAGQEAGTGTGTEEKIDQIRVYAGEKYTVEQEVPAGSVCALAGPALTFCGQGLGEEKEDTVPLLEPVMTYRIVLPPGSDVHRMYNILCQLEEEEPQLHIVWKEQIGEIHAQLMGEVQIEILRSLIRERFGVEVDFDEGSIVYKETIADTVEGVGHFEPLRHYAEVHLILEPGERGSGLQFYSRCSEDKLDRNWQRLILTHLEEREHPGVLTGSPITDMRITLVAGKAHIKHTEGGDFRQSTYRAVRQGLCKAQSVLLEPIYEFRIEVPAALIGRVMADIQARAGSFTAPETVGEYAVLAGTVPVSEMGGYQASLLSYSGGKGRLTTLLKGYEPCHNAEEVIDRIGYRAEHDTANPCGSVFCAHGAGFVVEWDQVESYMHLESVLEKPAGESGNFAAGYARRNSGSKSSTAEDFIGQDEIEEIFNRTYGSRERKKPGYAKTIAPSVRDDSKYRGETRPQEEYLLVDGYNIIFAWEELRELAGINLDGARGRLTDILSDYQAYRRMHLILVFDAYKVKGNPGSVVRYHNIDVVYTKEAETADQYIEKVAHAMNRKYRVRVATSDGLEQLIIMGAGAVRVSARELWEEVMAVRQELRQEYMGIQGTGAGDKKYLLDDISKEVAEYLKQAGEEEGAQVPE